MNYKIILSNVAGSILTGVIVAVMLHPEVEKKEQPVISTAVYKILWSASSDDLEVTVSNHLDDGWLLSGSLSSVSPSEGHTVFYQPVMRALTTSTTTHD